MVAIASFASRNSLTDSKFSAGSVDLDLTMICSIIR
jgi:hypothetical protein